MSPAEYGEHLAAQEPPVDAATRHAAAVIIAQFLSEYPETPG